MPRKKSPQHTGVVKCSQSVSPQRPGAAEHRSPATPMQGVSKLLGTLWEAGWQQVVQRNMCVLTYGALVLLQLFFLHFASISHHSRTQDRVCTLVGLKVILGCVN